MDEALSLDRLRLRALGIRPNQLHPAAQLVHQPSTLSSHPEYDADLRTAFSHARACNQSHLVDAFASQSLASQYSTIKSLYKRNFAPVDCVQLNKHMRTFKLARDNFDSFCMSIDEREQSACAKREPVMRRHAKAIVIEDAQSFHNAQLRALELLRI